MVFAPTSSHCSLGWVGHVWGAGGVRVAPRASNLQRSAALGRRGGDDLLPEGVAAWPAEAGLEWDVAADQLLRSPVSVILGEGNALPPVGHPLWIGFEGILVVVGNGRRRSQSAPPAWRRGARFVGHHELGGVTDLSTHVTWLQRSGSGPAFGLKDPEGVDAPPTSIVDVRARTPPGSEICPPEGSGFDPRRDKLRWPWVRDGTLLALPSAFTRSGWARRALTPDESLRGADLPPASWGRRSGEERRRLARRIATPIKVLAWVGTHLAHWVLADEADPAEAGTSPLERELKRRPEAVGAESSVADDRGVSTSCDGPLTGNHRGLERVELHGDAAVKLAKEDGAEVPVFIWNDRVASALRPTGAGGPEASHLRALGLLRRASHRWWVRAVVSSWWAYWGCSKERIRLNEPGHWRAVGMAGALAVGYAAQSDFWEWLNGSGIFFWRWPEEHQCDLALGLAPQWTGEPPASRLKQGRLGADKTRDQLLEKIVKLERRGYLCPGEPLSLLNYFAVPKGESDIRTVFDGTKSGLNQVLFSNWFPLPQVDALLRCLEEGYFCSDNDVGEQFYNFPLHPALRPYCGVDVGDLRSSGPRLLLWRRLVMGLRPSPYQAVRDNRRAKFLVCGRASVPGNIFGWARVERNYPGSSTYRPERPWISKRTAEGYIAPEVLDYVDDNRTTGHDYETAWRASTQLAKGYSFLGIQDATRKRRTPTTQPGPWAGMIVRTDGSVKKSVSQDRWDKTRRILAQLREGWEASRRGGKAHPGVKRADLEKAAGFLVYVSRAYTSMRPYLKGLHLTLHGWRADRLDGWRVQRDVDEELTFVPDTDEPPPEFVRPVSRFEHDLRALESLTECAAPPELPIRPSGKATAYYGFGDASGAGFGVSVWDPETGVDAAHGLWADHVSERSSNFREAMNLVLKVESMVEEGTLHAGVELFLFTDNFVAETIFFKGDARSEPLFEAALRLRKLEMEHGLFIHLVWVSGKRMIAQGTDGLSRGDLTTGVMKGDHMLDYVPLHLSVVDRSSKQVEWLLSECLPLGLGEEWTRLTESEWFGAPFWDDGAFLWTPPPCSADVAVSLAAEAHHVRPWNTHVFLVPSIMAYKWRRQLGKAADLLVVLPFDDELWPADGQFEQDLLGEWRAPTFGDESLMRCKACKKPVSHSSGVVCANFGRARGNFPPCKAAWHGRCYGPLEGDAFPTGLRSRDDSDDEGEWAVAPGKAERWTARAGDHLMCPFQCELCHFRNIEGANPRADHKGHCFLLLCMRRANIDAFWARKSSTVKSNLYEARRLTRSCTRFGVRYPVGTRFARGPCALDDEWGMMLACGLLERTLDPGRNSITVQYSTARRLQAAVTNYAFTTEEGGGPVTVLSDRYKQRFSGGPTATLFYERFSLGCHERMGDVIQRDQALTIKALEALLAMTELDASSDTILPKERYEAILLGSALTIGYSTGLRGEELALCKLDPTISETSMSVKIPGKPFLTLVLEGSFKGVRGRKQHRFTLAPTSSSGVLRNRTWLRRLVVERTKAGGARKGPLFCRRPGGAAPIRIAELDEIFHRYLVALQERTPELLGPGVDVERSYSFRRSVRRGSTTHALNRGVPGEVVDANNRWRKAERAGNRDPSLPMLQMYTDAVASVDLNIRYSQSL